MKKITTALVFVAVLFLGNGLAYSQSSVSDTSESLKIILGETSVDQLKDIKIYRKKVVGEYKQQFAKLQSDTNSLYSLIISPASTQEQIDEATAKVTSDEAVVTKMRVDILYFISQHIDVDKRTIVDPQIKKLLFSIDLRGRPENKTCAIKT